MTLRLWLVVGLVFAVASASADVVPRVGAVDVQAVLTKSAKGISAKQILDKEKDGYQTEMNVRRQELEILRDEIEKPELSPSVKREKQEQFERNQRDTARRADNFTRALESHEQVLVRQLLEEVVKVVRELAVEQSYDAIVENRKSQAIYARPNATIADTTQAVDVTDDVIRRLDSRQFVPQ